MYVNPYFLLLIDYHNTYGLSLVARSPPKLQDLLRQRGIPESDITDNLSIVAGNVTDVDAVRQTLIHNGCPVDLIVSGIGGKMVFDNPLKPTLDNPTVCQDAIRTILAAARPLERKPMLITLSTTGISSKKRDLPCAMIPMYNWMLKAPHADKKVMESLVLEEMEKPVADRAIENWVIVRPSLLTDGKGDGLDKVKVGVEEKPAVGYTISRNDVGLWMFERLVRSPLRQDNPYLGQIVTITS